jgi:hypothetical protein
VYPLVEAMEALTELTYSENEKTILEAASLILAVYEDDALLLMYLNEAEAAEAEAEDADAGEEDACPFLGALVDIGKDPLFYGGIFG